MAEFKVSNEQIKETLASIQDEYNYPAVLFRLDRIANAVRERNQRIADLETLIRELGETCE